MIAIDEFVSKDFIFKNVNVWTPAQSQPLSSISKAIKPIGTSRLSSNTLQGFVKALVCTCRLEILLDAHARIQKIFSGGGGGVKISRRGLTENFNMAKINNLAIPPSGSAHDASDLVSSIKLPALFHITVEIDTDMQMIMKCSNKVYYYKCKKVVFLT